MATAGLGVSRQALLGDADPDDPCDACGAVPVPREQLPIVLPDDVSFDIPGNPLDRNPSWNKADCPRCGAAARRENDTLDTFVDSSWYFIRFASQPGDAPFDRTRPRAGCRSTSISAAWSMRSSTCSTPASGRGAAPHRPARRGRTVPGLFTQGMVTHETYKAADGRWLSPEGSRTRNGILYEAAAEPGLVGRIEKMSKSKRNTVDPEPIVDQYGRGRRPLVHALRQPAGARSSLVRGGIEGSWRFVQRLWRLAAEAAGESQSTWLGGEAPSDKALERKLHQTIAAVGANVEALAFNKAVANVYELANAIEKAPSSPSRSAAIRTLVLLVAPMVPHLAEQAWAALGESGLIADADGPKSMLPCWSRIN
jgi:leucyl-tRNA synthetase